MKCEKCGEEKPITNKHFCLCRECNNIRLYGNKYGKRHNYATKISNSLRTHKKGFKTKTKQSYFAPNFSKEEKKINIILEDELFYEKCFNLSNHKCEECGCDLPETFRDDDGKIIARYRYSHIVPKSLSKSLRHNITNINHLCLKHHIQWDFGDKKSMKIYDKNRRLFLSYL